MLNSERVPSHYSPTTRIERQKVCSDFILVVVSRRWIELVETPKCYPHQTKKSADDFISI